MVTSLVSVMTTVILPLAIIFILNVKYITNIEHVLMDNAVQTIKGKAEQDLYTDCTLPTTSTWCDRYNQRVLGTPTLAPFIHVVGLVPLG